jgi:hypothetical protein
VADVKACHEITAHNQKIAGDLISRYRPG